MSFHHFELFKFHNLELIGSGSLTFENITAFQVDKVTFKEPLAKENAFHIFYFIFILFTNLDFFFFTGRANSPASLWLKVGKLTGLHLYTCIEIQRRIFTRKKTTHGKRKF